MNGEVNWVADRIVAMLGGILKYLSSSMFLSPDVTVLPEVRALLKRSLYVVDAGYGLAFLSAGVIAMVSSSLQTQYRVKELAPRLVVAFVLSNFAAPLCGGVISLANALTVALSGPSAPAGAAVRAARAHVRAAQSDAATGVIAIVLGLLVVVLMLILIVGWIGRVGVLLVLAGVGPVALACYCLPQLQGAAQLWWRTLLGCLAAPALQAIAFATGVNILLDPAASVQATVGLPGGDIVNLLIVICLLWTTVKIPGLIGKAALRRGGLSVGALVARALSVQTITRRVLPSAGRRR